MQFIFQLSSRALLYFGGRSLTHLINRVFNMFRLEAKNAVLDGLKLLAQKDGEKDYFTAHKMKFVCEVGGDVIHTLMGGNKDIPEVDWWHGEYRDMLFAGISGMIKSKASFDECDVKFKDVPRIKDAVVKEFSFIPENGGKAKVICYVQAILTDQQIVKIEGYYKKGGKLTIKTDSVFDPLDDDEQQSEIPLMD